MNGFDLPAAQFGSAPAEDEEDAETPTNSSGIGQVGSALHDVFGQKSTFALRPPPLQGAQFTPSGATFGGSIGGTRSALNRGQRPR
jgi:hypothetical protein